MVTVMATREPQFYTSGKVARILGITKRTLLNWIASEKIPAPPANPQNGYLQWTVADVETIRAILREESNDSTGNS
jgi:DNA-binding transcriptional MerR regulator